MYTIRADFIWTDSIKYNMVQNYMEKLHAIKIVKVRSLGRIFLNACGQGKVSERKIININNLLNYGHYLKKK